MDFLYEMYKKGVPLTGKAKKELKRHGYFELEALEKAIAEKAEQEKLEKQSSQQEAVEKIPKEEFFPTHKLERPPKEIRSYPVADVSTEKEKLADSSVDIIIGDLDILQTDTAEPAIVSSEEYKKEEGKFEFSGGREIKKADWMPESVIYHKRDFVAWINSINSGFRNIIPYKPFKLYCQQSETWLMDKGDLYQLETLDQRREFAWREIDRIKENSLYFLDKYLLVKEASFTEGYMDYKSHPAHKVMAFLFDCGYSVEMIKGRQMAATTTLAGLALVKLITRKNFFIKMIAQDKEKVEEIFEDKIKYPFAALPEWMYHEVTNDRDNILALGRKDKKGKKGGVNSRMQVVAPSVAAINGGAPPLVLIDEGGYINILGKMIKEARPTMFMEDPITKKITMKRQLWTWGTGGESDAKGKAFEEEFMGTMKKWQNGDYKSGMVPVFFDWTTRPGATQEHYDNEKKVYTVDGPDSDSKMVQFRQAYPAIIEDVFLTSAKTLVSIAYINRRLEQIRSMPHETRSTPGFFEPIYDTSKPSKENDDLPYDVIGATFVPCQKGDPRISTWIFLEPKPDWEYRYYQGTDPIMTDNGYSNMASSIWDAQFNTVVAITSYRNENHKYTFLQCLLLGLYYDTSTVLKKKRGVKDLVEINVGTAYVDYKEYRGFYDNLVHRTELPSQFLGGNAEIGIDNRTSRTKFIINKLHELIVLYGDRIMIEEFWSQLRNFVCKITEKGNETWETSDKRKYMDDVLHSTVFSYICANAYSFRPPRNSTRQQDRTSVVWELRTKPDGTLTRVPVRVK